MRGRVSAGHCENTIVDRGATPGLGAFAPEEVGAPTGWNRSGAIDGELRIILPSGGNSKESVDCMCLRYGIGHDPHGWAPSLLYRDFLLRIHYLVDYAKAESDIGKIRENGTLNGPRPYRRTNQRHIAIQ
jgi:hypothetical protein